MSVVPHSEKHSVHNSSWEVSRMVVVHVLVVGVTISFACSGKGVVLFSTIRVGSAAIMKGKC